MVVGSRDCDCHLQTSLNNPVVVPEARQRHRAVIARAARLVGIAFKPAFVVSNCVPNILTALHNRHLAPFPYPIDCLPNQPYIYSEQSKREIASYFCVEPDAWHVRKSLAFRQRIADSIAADPPRPNLVKAHIKTEICCLMPSKARLIQASFSNRDSYEFADEYRAYTHALVAWTAIPRIYCTMHVMLRSACGLNHVEMAAQMSEWIHSYGRLAKYFIDDISNMDGSVQMVHLDEQISLYQACDEKLAQHARASVLFRGFVQTKGPCPTSVGFGGRATVKSGSQDTSSGQTTRRIDTFVRSLAGTGVTHIIGFAFGDDLWVMLLGVVPSPDAMYQLQARCGWKTKGVYVDCPEQTDFLACSLVPDVAGKYALVPLLGRQFAKLFWTWRPLPQRFRAGYMRQVAVGMLPHFAGFHFVEDWLRWHLQYPTGPVMKGFKNKWLARPFHTTPCLWKQFIAARYGLDMPEIFNFKQFPKENSVLLHHPWANEVMRYDLTDPAMRNTF